MIQRQYSKDKMDFLIIFSIIILVLFACGLVKPGWVVMNSVLESVRSLLSADMLVWVQKLLGEQSFFIYIHLCNLFTCAFNCVWWENKHFLWSV